MKVRDFAHALELAEFYGTPDSTYETVDDPRSM